MMPIELSLGAAILVGLLGSSHCIGMCGGIVGALNMGLDPLDRRPGALLGFQLAYNSGRILSYVVVGALAASFGAGIVSIEIVASPVPGRLFAAAFMVALGLYLTGWWRGLAVLERLGAKFWRYLQPLGRRLFPLRHPLQALLLGMIWGWLPCGLVYAVVAWSLTTADPVEGALLMFGFGLGTLPAMLVTGVSLNRYQGWASSPTIRTLAGVMIIGFGLYSGLNGLTPAHQHHVSAPDISVAPVRMGTGDESQGVRFEYLDFTSVNAQHAAVLKTG